MCQSDALIFKSVGLLGTNFDEVQFPKDVKTC